MLVMRRDDGTFEVFPMNVEQIEMTRPDPFRYPKVTYITVQGRVASARPWRPGDDLPFEQEAIEQMPPQIGAPTGGWKSCRSTYGPNW